jgi:hypothetical protein
VSLIAALALKRGKSVDFTGYWQRHVIDQTRGWANQGRRITGRWNRGVNPFFLMKECCGGLSKRGLNQHKLEVGDSSPISRKATRATEPPFKFKLTTTCRSTAP